LCVLLLSTVGHVCKINYATISQMLCLFWFFPFLSLYYPFVLHDALIEINTLFVWLIE